MPDDVQSNSPSESPNDTPGTNTGQPPLPTGRMVLGIWIMCVAIGYSVTGTYLGELVEGLDPSLMSKAPVVVSAVALLVAITMTILWARGRERAGATAGEPVPGAARRRFLVGGAGVLGGLVATVAATVGRNLGWMTVTGPNITIDVPTRAPTPRPQWQGARVQNYRVLGRTGFAVSDISLGSGRIKGEQGERVARMAIERGVNYFDTAPDYSGSGSELALGRAMKGQRDKMFLATKFCTPNGHLPPDSSPEHHIEAVEASLKRLQTDYVDLVHIHSCDSLERLLAPNVHEAFERLREQGKARFLGFSTHTPNLEQVTATAIDDGRFDVMMLAYHHGAWPKLADLVDRASAAGIGVVAMKTLKGAKHRGLLEDRDEADSYPQAAFKWVLANPSVACLVISFIEPGNVDEYLYASGKAPLPNDHALLEKYDRLIAGRHCYPHCGDCLDACPLQAPINDVLRHKMYFESYGNEREAMRLYSALGEPAAACASCPAPCAAACTHGVAIPEQMREAHRLLALS